MRLFKDCFSLLQLKIFSAAVLILLGFALIPLSIAGKNSHLQLRADNSGLAESNTMSQDRQSDHSLVPTDQSKARSDLKITQKIRQDLMADDSLSMLAKNIKIITVQGRVTLRGLVNNAQERENIEAKARKWATDDKVVNLIEVKNR